MGRCIYHARAESCFLQCWSNSNPFKWPWSKFMRGLLVTSTPVNLTSQHITILNKDLHFWGLRYQSFFLPFSHFDAVTSKSCTYKDFITIYVWIFFEIFFQWFLWAESRPSFHTLFFHLCYYRNQDEKVF